MLFDICRYFFIYRELGELNETPIMLVCHDVDRGFVWKGRKYSQLLDSISDRFKMVSHETISVSLPFSKKNMLNYNDPINVNGLMARALVFDCFLSLFNKNCLQKYRIRVWLKVLDRISPKVIIGIQPPPELCFAAHSRGIWIADLQHGVISGEGYYGKTFREKYKQNSWPSCILCWNSRSRNWVEQNIGSTVDAVVIGNPWVCRFIDKSKKDSIAWNYPAFGDYIESDGLNILISTQWGTQFNEFQPTGLPKGLINCIKNHGKKYSWWIRIHPVLLDEGSRPRIYGALKREFRDCDNVFWERSTDLPLPIILEGIDLHITLSSAVTIEAAWFGISTALLGTNHSDISEWFDGELKGGLAELIDSHEDTISRWIKKQETLLASKAKYSHIEMLNEFMAKIVLFLDNEKNLAFPR